MNSLLTPAASRALELANRIAHFLQAAETEPEHLLWALLRDESRAAEILAAHRVGSEQARQLCDLPAEFTDDSVGDDVRPPPAGEALREVLIEARHQAMLLGRQVETGSEHLLWGLATVASPVRELLQAHGLHGDHVAKQTERQSGTSAHPIKANIRLAAPPDRPSDAADVYRLLDAAANRAREGLRVLEDYVRFTLDDKHLTSLLKNWRHDLSQALSMVDPRALLAARDTQGDVGTAIHTQRERTRESLLDVVRAGFKRVQEAVRSLEEYAKVVVPDLGDRLGQLRYPLYTLERAVLGTQASRDQLAACDLYLVVTEELCVRGSGPVIRSSLAGGVRIVQVREKQMPDRKLLEHARRVREWTREANTLFIMNDRPDLALLSDADGVHVGQEELSVREVRRVLGPSKIVGVSTHTIEQARQAVLDGADYIGVGPVFPSSTKSFERLAGLEFVKQVAAEITLPAFAIGGIGPKNISDVVSAGARCVAVSSALCNAEQSEFVARELRSALAQAGGIGTRPADEDQGLHG